MGSLKHPDNLFCILDMELIICLYVTCITVRIIAMTFCSWFIFALFALNLSGQIENMTYWKLYLTLNWIIIYNYPCQIKLNNLKHYLYIVEDWIYSQTKSTKLKNKVYFIKKPIFTGQGITILSSALLSLEERSGS